MAQETLFRILSRQPWWVSALVAAALFGVANLVYAPIAPFIGIPFAAVALYVAFHQLRGGAPVPAAERLAALREMPWENFSLIISEAYRRQGYAVAAAASPGHDYAVTKSGRTTLVQCRRWKVNQVGAGPVRELSDAIDRLEAYHGVCIAAGDFTANAREFAAGRPITLMSGPELAALVATVEKTSRRWFGP